MLHRVSLSLSTSRVCHELSSAQLFAVLTAKFNFYCCLTLLNDFYCLLSLCLFGRSLCKNLIKLLLALASWRLPVPHCCPFVPTTAKGERRGEQAYCEANKCTMKAPHKPSNFPATHPLIGGSVRPPPPLRYMSAIWLRPRPPPVTLVNVKRKEKSS